MMKRMIAAALVMVLMLCCVSAALGDGIGNAHILEACKEMIAGKWEALNFAPMGSYFEYTEGEHFLFITPGNDVYLVWLNENGKYNPRNCAQIAFSTDGTYLMVSIADTWGFYQRVE